MKLVYIAGPFRPLKKGDQWEQTLNIRRAEELALDVWRAGAVAICPHLNTCHFEGHLPGEVWLNGDLEILRRCDALLATSFWRNSDGASKEVAFAAKHSMPVFYEDNFWALVRWLRGVS